MSTIWPIMGNAHDHNKKHGVSYREQGMTTARDELDLCVRRGEKWEIFATYDGKDREKAIKDAQYLRHANEFKAIYLLDEFNRQVLYGWEKTGEHKNYASILVELSRGRVKKQDSHHALDQLYESRRQRHAVRMRMIKETATAERVPNALKVGFGGFVITLIVVFILTNRGMGVGGAFMTMLMMCVATIYVALWVHAAFDMKDPQRMMELAEKEFQSRMKPAQDMLEKFYREGKNHRWDGTQRRMADESHFALILYLLGASRTLGQHHNLPLPRLEEHIAKLMREIGIDSTSVYNCGRHLEEYLAYPRYFQMIDMGRDAAKALLENPEAPSTVRQALDIWSAQQQKEAEQKDIESTAAIMFTDIVDFTKQTQQYGDAWMLDVLHAHNEIVRESLNHFHGREVKHTGDGIMASFTNVENACGAATAIQKGIDTFNQKMPARSFGVRIGLSAGQPVHMDGDLFGTPVNMAARVMQVAGTGEIAVAESAHTILNPIGFYKFDALSNIELKGFDGQHNVYKLRWREHKPRPVITTQDAPPPIPPMGPAEESA